MPSYQSSSRSRPVRRFFVIMDALAIAASGSPLRPTPMPAAPVLNLAAYRFWPIEAPQSVREHLFERGVALGVKGTILVSSEGLNAVLAGPEQACREMLASIRGLPGFAPIVAKESWSQAPPFRRFKVKVKREIIRMDHPTIRPVEGRAPTVDAPTLARWLDQGHDDAHRPVVLLDTRNGFEVDHGGFAGALDWRLNQFTEFPKALAEHREALEGKTVVTYCTGGIRCEKAALYMQSVGLNDVLQLEGGILNYFELTDGRHYQGRCFVFDEREALDSDLSAIRHQT